MTQRSFKIIFNKRNIVRDRISCELRRESNPGLLLFCFTTLFDWLRKLALRYSQSDAKLKPAATCSRVFPALLSLCLFFAVSCNEPRVFLFIYFFFFSFALSGHCNYFGLGLRESIEMRTKYQQNIINSDHCHFCAQTLPDKTTLNENRS